MVIVHSDSELDLYLDSIQNSEISFFVGDSSLNLVFCHNIEEDSTYCVIYNHSDAPSGCTKSILIDSKISSGYLNFSNFLKSIPYDFTVSEWINEGTVSKLNDLNRYLYKYTKFYSKETYKYYTPISIFYKYFKYIVDKSLLFLESDNLSQMLLYSKIFLNNFRLSKHGVYLDIKKVFDVYGTNLSDSIIHPKYNMFTSTGRSTVSYGKINLSAIPKEESYKSCFTSRFSDRGFLIECDVKSSQVNILSELFNIPLPKEDFYSYLLKKYDFFKNKSTSEVKKEVFSSIYSKNMYSGDIEELSVLSKYKYQVYSSFIEKGRLEHPRVVRTVLKSHIQNPHPGKVLAYLMQIFEVEFIYSIVSEISKFLKNHRSKVSFTVYDSFIIDFCKEDGMDVFNGILKIIKNYPLPIRVKTGKNLYLLKEYAN